MLEALEPFGNITQSPRTAAGQKKHDVHDILESIHKASLYRHKINLSRHILYRERSKVGFPRGPLGVTLLGQANLCEYALFHVK